LLKSGTFFSRLILTFLSENNRISLDVRMMIFKGPLAHVYVHIGSDE
jgi:hypothetical protein